MTTHEPENPLPNYPHSHVKVDDVFMENCSECVKITIHGVEHFLHRTTAFALYDELQQYFKKLSRIEKNLLIQFGSDLGEELLSNS